MVNSLLTTSNYEHQIMNIKIYYNSKIILLQARDQTSQNQAVINIDRILDKELFDHFEKFIQQTFVNEIIFETENLHTGLQKFADTFKYILAAGGLIKKSNAYLFIYRLKTWDLPKGKLDKGETPEAAAIRECEEECGITKLTITKILSPTYHMYEHKKSYAFKKTFWYAMTTQYSGILIPQLEENIEKVEWLTPEEIKKTVSGNSYFAILDVIKEGVTES